MADKPQIYLGRAQLMKMDGRTGHFCPKCKQRWLPARCAKGVCLRNTLVCPPCGGARLRPGDPEEWHYVDEFADWVAECRRAAEGA